MLRRVFSSLLLPLRLPGHSMAFSSSTTSAPSSPEPEIDWREKDANDLREYNINRFYKKPEYVKLVNKWKKPLARKQASKERKRERDAMRVRTF